MSPHTHLRLPIGSYVLLGLFIYSADLAHAEPPLPPVRASRPWKGLTLPERKISLKMWFINLQKPCYAVQIRLWQIISIHGLPETAGYTNTSYADPCVGLKTMNRKYVTTRSRPNKTLSDHTLKSQWIVKLVRLIARTKDLTLIKSTSAGLFQIRYVQHEY